MKCAVITPVGPGHDSYYQECDDSVVAAVRHSPGPFSEIVHRPVDDTRGSMGRSAARNKAVMEAYSEGIDWVFFLDADDLLLPDAFSLVEEHVSRVDGIWGAIMEMSKGSAEAKLRDRQDQKIASVNDILSIDPFYSLQMGHFVRAHVACANPFNELMNTGEDFDYYLRVWYAYRCIKLDRPLFINRQGLQSEGPRSATGGEWRDAVIRGFVEFKLRHGL